MLLACFPLGPWVTSKLTFWPSFNDLKPCMLIAEKCANRSSPPSSGVMNPYPFASLNHLTVPVAIVLLPSRMNERVLLFGQQTNCGRRDQAATAAAWEPNVAFLSAESRSRQARPSSNAFPLEKS